MLCRTLVPEDLRSHLRPTKVDDQVVVIPPVIAARFARRFLCDILDDTFVDGHCAQRADVLYKIAVRDEVQRR